MSVEDLTKYGHLVLCEAAVVQLDYHSYLGAFTKASV